VDRASSNPATHAFFSRIKFTTIERPPFVFLVQRAPGDVDGYIDNLLQAEARAAIDLRDSRRQLGDTPPVDCGEIKILSRAGQRPGSGG
jgi:hypothetical protein